MKHCFEDGPNGDSTCLLERGHKEPHDFTPDSEIEVSFK